MKVGYTADDSSNPILATPLLSGDAPALRPVEEVHVSRHCWSVLSVIVNVYRVNQRKDSFQRNKNYHPVSFIFSAIVLQTWPT